MAALNPWLVISGALVALAVVWIVMTSGEATDNQPVTEIATNVPDIQAEDVAFSQLNPDGSLHYRLLAEHIRQFDDEQMTRMSEPELHMTGSGQSPWDIKSNTGYIRKLPDDAGTLEDVVYLREEVSMVQNHPTSGLVTLRSEVFYIYPDRQFAETDQSVMIDTEVGRTRAAGMRADLESGKLTLSSDARQRVHTIVLPEQFKNS